MREKLPPRLKITRHGEKTSAMAKNLAQWRKNCPQWRITATELRARLPAGKFRRAGGANLQIRNQNGAVLNVILF